MGLRSSLVSHLLSLVYGISTAFFWFFCKIFLCCCWSNDLRKTHVQASRTYSTTLSCAAHGPSAQDWPPETKLFYTIGKKHFGESLYTDSCVCVLQGWMYQEWTSFYEAPWKPQPFRRWQRAFVVHGCAYGCLNRWLLMKKRNATHLWGNLGGLCHRVQSAS